MVDFAQGQDQVQTPAVTILVAADVFSLGVSDVSNAEPFLTTANSTVGVFAAVQNIPDVVPTEFPAEFNELNSGGADWFERFHVIPRSFDFGNLLSDQSISIEVFSAFRRDTHEWTSFINNAGAGVSLGDQPTLPTDVDAMSGVVMTLDVTATGDAFVDTTLDFVFDSGTTLVPIVIQRIVLFGLEPELAFSEFLLSLTDIIPSKDGTEKRQAIRDNPRQAWNYRYIMEEGTQRQTLENLLFDFQSRVFGVPVWDEDSTMTVASIADDMSITVNSTDFRNYSVGGLAIIITDQSTFDVLSIASFTSTTLTFDSAIVNAYGIGTKVFPLATCTAQPVLSGSRFPVGLSSINIRFENTSNEADLDDTSAFSSFNGKVLLDNGNSLSGELAETHQREFITLDSLSGIKLIDSPWDNNRRGHTFTLRADGRQAIWEMRGLAHALNGRWLSFYVPRDSDDLEVTADLVNGSAIMTVTNVGYAQFVRNRQAKNVIRVTVNDGTVLLRTITDSSVATSTTDQLTVDTVWPSTIAFGDITRVEYVEKVRMDSDSVRFEHDGSGSRARMVVPLKTVLE